MDTTTLNKRNRDWKNQLHFVSRKQFAIQLATSKRIRQSQGWLLDEMVFGLRNICKHGPTYTTFSHIGTTE